MPDRRADQYEQGRSKEEGSTAGSPWQSIHYFCDGLDDVGMKDMPAMIASIEVARLRRRRETQRERADGELECFAMDFDHAEAALQLAAAGWAGQP